MSEIKRYVKSLKGSIVVTDMRSVPENQSPAKVGTTGGPGPAV